jgi:CheY-like chemotaxis protein
MPAIALTAYAGEDDRRRSMEAGFQAHLLKPVNAGELISAVNRLGRGNGNAQFALNVQSADDSEIAASV